MSNTMNLKQKVLMSISPSIEFKSEDEFNEFYNNFLKEYELNNNNFILAFNITLANFLDNLIIKKRLEYNHNYELNKILLKKELLIPNRIHRELISIIEYRNNVREYVTQFISLK